MAGPFNKDLPNTDLQPFFHWPKPDSEPKLMSPTGVAAEAIGKGIEGGAEELNKGVQKGMQNTAENRAEELTKQYLVSTETRYDKDFPGELASPASESLIPGKPDVPSMIEDKLKSAANTKLARDQGATPGHIRDTQYYADIYKAASELRTRFPGYRDYIDKGFEKVTGFTPNANAYMQKLLGDINELANKKNSADTHNKNFLFTRTGEGDTNARKQVILAGNGSITWDQAMINYSIDNHGEHDATVAKRNYETLKSDTGTLQVHAMNDVRANASRWVNGDLRNFYAENKLTPEVLQKLDSGEYSWKDIGIDPRNVMGAIHNRKMAAEARLNSWLDEPIQINGTKTTRRVAGEKEIPDAIKQSLAVYDNLEESFKNSDFGHINRIKNAINDTDNNMKWNVWNTPEGAIFRYAKMFNDFGGSQFLSTLYGSAGFKFQDLPTSSSMEAILGHAMSGEPRNGLNGIKEALDTIEKQTHGENPVLVKGYLMTLGQLVQGDKVPDKAKINVLKYLFDPKEQGWIDYIKESGESVAKHDMFRKFTDPTFSSKVAEIAGKHDPALLDRYHNWVFNTFNKELFTNDIQSLAEIRDYPHAKIKWNTETKPPRFEAIADYSTYGVSAVKEGSAKAFNTQLTRLNMGIAALYGVFQDRTPGIITQEFANRNIPIEPNSIPAKMMEALRNHVAPKEGGSKSQDRAPSAKTEAKPESKPERKQGTMNQFNPAAVAPAGAVPRNKDWEHPDTVGEFIDRMQRHPKFQALMDTFSDAFGRTPEKPAPVKDTRVQSGLKPGEVQISGTKYPLYANPDLVPGTSTYGTIPNREIP